MRILIGAIGGRWSPVVNGCYRPKTDGHRGHLCTAVARQRDIPSSRKVMIRFANSRSAAS